MGPLSELTSVLAHDPTVATATGGSARPVAVPEAGRALFAATLARATARKPVVVAVPTGVEAERIAGDLREYLGADAVELFPAWETLPFERVSPATETMGRRLRVMCATDEAALTDEQIRRARHAYFAAISYLDERVGTVLGALRDSGLEDDTIVLFTADHGEMLGERGLWFKMAFFEAAARVPLVVRVPGGPGGVRVAEPVSQLDLAPTLLELCGLGGAGAMDGRSLAPALAGGALAETDVVAEYLAEGVTSPAVMLRRGRHKYIWCADDPEQLYDVEADPRELADLAPSQPALCAELRAELERRWDMPALRAAVLRSQEERRVVVEALRHGQPASWNFVPGADAEFVRGSDDLYAFQRRARLDAPVGRGETA